MWWWPRRRRDEHGDGRGWPGPPHPLPGGSPREGDAWTGALSARPTAPHAGPVVLLPPGRPIGGEWT